MYIENLKIYSRVEILHCYPPNLQFMNMVKPWNNYAYETCSYWKNSVKSSFLVRETYRKVSLLFYKILQTISQKFSRYGSKASHKGKLYFAEKVKRKD